MAEITDTSGTVKSAHKGFDRWWDGVQLQLQMYVRIAGLVLLVQGLVVSGLCLAFTNTTQRSVTVAYYYAKAARTMFSSPTVDFVVDGKDYALPAREILKSQNFKRVAHGQTAKVASIWLVTCLLWLAVPVAVRRFKEKAEVDMAVEHIRGPQLLTVPELVTEIKQSGKKTRLVFGGVPLPVDFESEHIGIFGKTRVGKSVLCYQLIEKMRGHKSIILDVKGDYVSKFYQPETDVIFNILDSRGAGWNIFNEIRNKLDVEAVGQSVIPDAKGGGSNEAFFNDAARAVLVGGMFVCISRGARTNAALRELVFNNTELMEQALNSVKEASRGHVFLQQPNSNLAGSVHAVLMQYCSWLEYMPEGGDFSLTDWVQDGKAGFLYLSTKKEIAKTLQPVISLFVDLAGRRILSWPDDPARRVYILLDEAGSLQRLNAFKDILTVGGGRGAVVIMTCQDFAQITEKYGKNDAETIFNSFGTILTLKLKDPNTAEFLSKTFGKAQFWETKESHVLGVEAKASITQSKDKRDEALVTAAQIQYLKKLEFFLQIPDFNPCTGMLQILPVNNTPATHPDFVLRDGFELVADDQAVKAGPVSIPIPVDPFAALLDLDDDDQDDQDDQASTGGLQVDADAPSKATDQTGQVEAASFELAGEDKAGKVERQTEKDDPVVRAAQMGAFEEPSF